MMICLVSVNAGNDISEISYNIPIRHAEGDAHNVCDVMGTLLYSFSVKCQTIFVLLNVKAYVYHPSFCYYNNYLHSIM